MLPRIWKICLSFSQSVLVLSASSNCRPLFCTVVVIRSHTTVPVASVPPTVSVHVYELGAAACMNTVARRPKARHGPRNRSGRPGDCRTCNLTNENSYVHISSTFVNAKWTKTHVGKRTHCGPFIIRKISEFDVTRCQISKPKCIKFDFRWRSALDPAGGSLQRSPKPPSCI